MNSTEAKFILQARRPDGADDAEPRFAEALEQARRDPALAAWLAREQAFDAAVAEKLRSTQPPAGLREAILAGAKVSRPLPFWRRTQTLAMAAQSYARKGDYKTSQDFYARAAKTNPTSPELRTQLAMTQAATGNNAAALATLDTVLKSGGDQARALATLTLVKLRARARAKFRRADEMYFTAAGLEQASTEGMAAVNAERFAEYRRVADLCSGIGGDLIALAQTHDVVSVDLDPVHLRMGEINARVYEPGARVEDVQSLANVLNVLNVEPGAHWFWSCSTMDMPMPRMMARIVKPRPMIPQTSPPIAMPRPPYDSGDIFALFIAMMPITIAAMPSGIDE